MPRGLGRRLPRGCLLALALLLLVEVGAARREWLWARDEMIGSGVLDALEDRAIQPADPPVVIVMGSSRATDAVVPRLLEEGLQLPRGSVLNLGLMGGTPFDGLLLYRRNRAKLSQARLLVFAIEDWYFNASIGPGILYRRFASLRERVGVFDRDATLSLIAGWFWRAYDARKPIRDLAASLFARPHTHRLRIAADGRIELRTDAREAGPETTHVEGIARGHYRPFEYGWGRLEQLEGLVALAREDGVRVLLVRLPWRDAYVDHVRQQYAKEYARSCLREGEIPGAQVYLYERASALGIPDTSFYDYGHLMPSGARIMTDVLARRVLATYGDLSEGVRTGSR